MVLAMLAVLGACVESKVNVVLDAETLEFIPPGNGVVIVRVVDASGSPYPVNHVTFAPQDVFEAAENKFVRINAASDSGFEGGVTSSQYVGVFESGEYSLSDLYSYHFFGEFYFQNMISVSPTFGTFAVQPGKVTNLGTVIYYTKPEGDRYSDVVARNDSFDTAIDYLKANYRAVADDVTNLDSPLGWTADDHESDRYTHYLSVVQNPVAFGETILFDDETVILAKAGTMLRSDNDGSWSFDAVESDLNLLGFDKNDRGDEVVAGEFGTVFFRSSQNQQWTRMMPPETGATIHSIVVNNQQQVFAYVEREREVLLYQGELSADPRWRAVLSYRNIRGWQPVSAATQSESSTSGKRVSNVNYARIDGAYYFIEGGKLFAMNFAGLEWSPVNIGFRISGLAPFRRRLTAYSGANRWNLRAVYRTGSELGADWNRITGRLDRCPNEPKTSGSVACPESRIERYRNFQHKSDPYFVSRTEGYSIMQHLATASKARGALDDPFLVKSTDGGGTWFRFEPADELPGYCTRLLPTRKDGTLLVGCHGTSGRIYELDIERLTYKTVREPSVF